MSTRAGLAMVVGLLIVLTGCAAPPRAPMALEPFETDGCTLFPDGTFKDAALWEDCCLEHDMAYWRGGTAAERLAADRALRECVLEKTGDAVLADAMFHGVRAGGASVFPSWYRWGYGWPYGRGARALTAEEKVQADALLEAWRAKQAASGR